jgi:outer membrane protein TolC
VIRAGILILLATLVQAKDLRVDQAWELVQERNDGLKASQSSVKHSQTMKDGADSMMYMPSIDLHGSYTHLSKPIDLDLSEPINGFQASLESGLGLPSGSLPRTTSDDATLDLSEQDVFLANISILWPIFAGGKTLYLSDIADAQIEAEKAKQELAQQKAFIQLVKYYYGAEMGRVYYETRIEVEEVFKKHYEHAQKLQEEGQIAKVELLNAQVQYDKATTETVKAHHKFTIATSALRMLLKEQDVNVTSPLFINDNMRDKDYYIQRAIDNYPALHLLDAKHRQTESVVGMERGNYMPTVVAFGNYNLYRDDSILSNSAPDWFAGVAVNINLLSATGRSEKYEAAKIVDQQLVLLQQQAKQDLSILVEKTYNEVILYLDEYKAIDSSLAMAEENVKLRRIAFNSGLSTSLELNDAELFLAAKKTERLKVAYDYVQKLSYLMILSENSERFMEMAANGEEVEQ